VSVRIAKSVEAERRFGLLSAGTVFVVAGLVAACSPQPDSSNFYFFMDDGLAREGVLARCNQDRDATLSDIECSNARRAAAAVALKAEQERSELFARESERKLLALRISIGREAEAQQSAEQAARAAAESAYEQQWKDPRAGRYASAGDAGNGGQGAAFGAPVGLVLPSIRESTLFNVYGEANGPLGRPEFEVAAVEPPANIVPGAYPKPELERLATIPRPFRTDETRAVPQ